MVEAAGFELAPRIAADGRRLGRRDAGACTPTQFERRIFPRLGDVRAEAVRRGDLLARLDAVKAEGKLRTSNVLLTDLKQMFRFARARDLLQRDPLDTVTKRDVGGTPAERERVLFNANGEVHDRLAPHDTEATSGRYGAPPPSSADPTHS